MSSHYQVFVFGDLTCDFDAGLQRLAGFKDNPLLTSFFERVAFALRAEIGTLSFHEREREGFVKFTTLVELLAKLRVASSPHPALEKALTCVHQFACFIRCVTIFCATASAANVGPVTTLVSDEPIQHPLKLASSVYVPGS
jgi:hypothetical protein